MFDYFRVTAGAPDTTAPTSAATLDPPGGTSTGPVTVTLTGADERLRARQARVPARRRRLDGVHDAGGRLGRRPAHARAPRDRQGRQRRHGRERLVHDPARGRRRGRSRTVEVAARCPGVLAVTPRRPGLVRRLHAGRDEGLPRLDHRHRDLERGQRGAHGPRPERDATRASSSTASTCMPQALQAKAGSGAFAPVGGTAAPTAAADLERRRSGRPPPRSTSSSRSPKRTTCVGATTPRR